MDEDDFNEQMRIDERHAEKALDHIHEAVSELRMANDLLKLTDGPIYPDQSFALGYVAADLEHVWNEMLARHEGRLDLDSETRTEEILDREE